MKSIFKVLSLALTLTMVLTCLLSTPLVANATSTAPVYDATKHTDLLASTDWTTSSEHVASSYDAATGATIANQYASAVYSPCQVEIPDEVVGDADVVYGNATVKVKSAYSSSNDNHAAHLGIASIETESGTWFLSLSFAIGFSPILSNVRSDHATLAQYLIANRDKTISSVKVAANTEYDVAWSLAGNVLSIWIDDVLVVDQYTLPYTLGNLTTVRGVSYSTYEISNYRVFVDDASEPEVPAVKEYVFDATKHTDLLASTDWTTSSEHVASSYDAATGATISNPYASAVYSPCQVEIPDEVVGDADVVYGNATVKVKSAYSSSNDNHAAHLGIASIETESGTWFLSLSFAIGFSPILSNVRSDHATLAQYLIANRDKTISSVKVAANTEYDVAWKLAGNVLSIWIDDVLVVDQYTVPYTLGNLTTVRGVSYSTYEITNYRVFIETAATGDDSVIDVGTVEAEADAVIDTSSVPDNYFVPYGGVYYETADGIEYVEKNEDGSFTAPVAGEYKISAFAMPGAEGVTTFAASAKVDEADADKAAVQYGSYVPAVADKTYGTMFMTGDWDAFVNYYVTNKGWTVAEIVEKVGAMYDANIGDGKNVAISAGADIVIYAYKMDQQKYMYKNDSVLQYALRVTNLPKDKTVTSVAYAKDDAGIAFSKKVVSASYNDLMN